MGAEASAPPIVLVHGLWLSPRSWEGWRERFETRGHRVLAPAWPRMEGEVDHYEGYGRRAGLGGGRRLRARLGRPTHGCPSPARPEEPGAA
jgi:hypothetical protein